MPAAHWTKILAEHEALHFLAFPLLSPYVASGGPSQYSKQGLSRKSDVLTFSCTSFFFSLVLMRCDSVFQGGPSLCRSALRTVCCCDLFPRGLCVHSNPKNRASLWQHCCRLTCDTPAHFLSECLTPSLNLFPSIYLCLPVTLHLASHSHLGASSWSDLSFLFWSLHSCSLPHLPLTGTWL